LLLVGGLLIKVGRLALLQRQRSGRAHAQAEAGTVAQVVADDPGLAVHQLDSPLGARSHAGTAAIAQFFVDFHDLSLAHNDPL